MRNLAAAALCGLAVLAIFCACAATAPKPADIPTKWELGFTFKDPKPIRVQVVGQDEPATFWYLQYTVTNQTEEEQIFVPEFVLYTDTGQILRAGQNVPSSVFRTIQSAKVLNEPLLKDTADISGPLLRGANNAKQGVMIFTDIDAQAGAFDVFVGGLSGETVRIRPPSAVETVTYDRENKKQVVMKAEVVLSKTLQLHYSLPGEAAARSETAAQLDSKTWVMR